MANRFVRRIRSGEIGTIEELKSEFKTLAKLSHPDLLGPGAEGDEFASIRQEYETALADFERHRFGARDARAEVTDAATEDAWPRLELLIKRGFPKIPRHEKETLRYEYARWRLARSLDGELGRLFVACESALLGMKAGSPEGVDLVLDFLRSLIEYRARGLPAMRTQIVLELGALRADPRVPEGARDFVRALALELGIGGEIGGVAGA
ncbi:MAG: hypothetical protein M0Z80_05380 [Treponema sp.]|nr:hypothetical protein [Treponema sp.]